MLIPFIVYENIYKWKMLIYNKGINNNEFGFLFIRQIINTLKVIYLNMRNIHNFFMKINIYYILSY